MLPIIKKELTVIKDTHGNARRTQSVPDEGEIAIEDLIANEGVLLTLPHRSLLTRKTISS